jgi:ABC-type multidrug transport system ATPase subunit
MHSNPARPSALVEAEQLGLALGGVPVLQQLSFSLQPGLTLVLGGDGRGKTSLLRLLAGTLAPSAGTLRRREVEVYFAQPADRAFDAVVVGDWLQQQAGCFPGWDAAALPALLDGFGLVEHLAKPMYMLSTGSRRKAGLVAAAASGARLTLLDTPYAAIDMPSGRLLSRLLADAAAGARRAWVVADHEVPAGLEGVRLAACIRLGD